MTITTIIPTYRRAERLRKAIKSVLNQTYSDFQVCIYDDASGDATKEVVSEFALDSRVKYVCHPQNIGSFENFQFALSRVKTPFFSFLSDDDFLLPEFYETALRGFEKFPAAAFSMGAVIDVDDKGRYIDIVLSKWPDEEYYSPPQGLLEMIGKYSNWTGILFRKEVIERIGFLDLRVKAIDVDYLFRAAAHLPFTLTKKPVAVFVQHPQSCSGSMGLSLIWPGWQIMCDKLREDQGLSLSVKKEIEARLQKDLEGLLIMNLVRSLAANKTQEAQAILAVMDRQMGKTWKKKFYAMVFMGYKIFPLSSVLILALMKLRRLCRR